MKKRYFIFCIINILVLASACNLKDADSKEPTDEKVLKSPPFNKLTDSVSRFPTNAQLYLRRAELLTGRELHKLANDDYSKAWNLSPDETTAQLYVANMFLAGKEEAAIRFLQECLVKFPTNPEFPRRLSEAYLQSGRSKEALAQYNEILEKDPSNFEAWYEKGLVLAQSGDTINAIRALEEAYKLQPLQIFGISLANMYAETKNEKALSLCNELIQQDSAQELTDALFIKGIYYSNVNLQELALEQFENCIRRDWKFTEAYIEKGIILFNDRNIDEALKAFALAAKVSNTYADAYFWMARCFETIGKVDEARENYRRALALDRRFIEAKKALERLAN